MTVGLSGSVVLEQLELEEDLILHIDILLLGKKILFTPLCQITGLKIAGLNYFVSDTMYLFTGIQ